MELIIGSHVNFNKEKQLVGCVNEIIKYGGNAFMFYTGAPQNTNRTPIDLKLVKEAEHLMKENNIDINNVIVHAPYIINPASNLKKEQYLFTINFLKQEIKRIENLGIKKIIVHPGSHMGLGVEKGIDNLAFVLNEVLNNTNIIICIETMAGKGNEIGKNLDELQSIISKIKKQNQIMVCLDTCHLFDAGYDITNFNQFLDEFNKKIGINKIGCVHINDSMNNINSKKDRHQNIGLGYIGFDALINIIYNEKIKNIPKILETPYITLDNEKNKIYPPYKEEIKMIKNKKYNPNLIDEIRNNIYDSIKE